MGRGGEKVAERARHEPGHGMRLASSLISAHVTYQQRILTITTYYQLKGKGTYLISLRVVALRDGGEEVVERAGHEAGHGVRLAGPRGAVREHRPGEPTQRAFHQRRTHCLVHFILHKTPCKLSHNYFNQKTSIIHC